MSRGRFEAHIDMAAMRQLGRKGSLVLRVSKDDAKAIKEMLRTYEKDAVKRVEAGEQPRRVAFLWDVAYGKRSLGKNNLTWALLTLTVRLMNEGMPDGKEKLTPVALYNQDMGDVAPCRGVECGKDDWQWLEEAGAKVKYVVPIEGTERVIAYVVKTSSKWNDPEAHRYIEHLFNRLAMMGVPLPDDEARLREWWFEWMAQVDESRIDLHAEELSPDAYRTLHPQCEGCMTFVGQGGGHLSHIKSVGAGGAEPQLARGSEWLHLCTECHLGIVHAKGWGAFKEAHPHLANKIGKALAQPAIGTGSVPDADHLINTDPHQADLFEGPREKRLADFDDDPLHPIF